MMGMMGNRGVGRIGRLAGIGGLVLALLVLGGCASGGGGEAPPQSEAAQEAAPPAGHPLAEIERGMTPTDVTKRMGDPSSERSYMTGKAFIPFYYGSDTHRTDWIYDGKGRVVFSRNRWSGALKVIRVDYDPSLGG